MKLTISIVVCLGLCAQLMADPIPAQQSQCKDSHFTVTADNELRVYVDGVNQQTKGLPNANDWTVGDTVEVPASARVIALRGVDTGVVAGLLASGADSKTDGSWKCTNIHTPGWVTVDFDDSKWPQATVIGNHGVAPWGTIAGISNEAQWIWTPNHVFGDTSDKTVYCRKTRGCSHEPPTTGKNCITSCEGQKDGDYQHCQRCDVYVTCSNQILYNERPCAPATPALVWDDSLKYCDYSSTTCTPV